MLKIRTTMKSFTLPIAILIVILLAAPSCSKDATESPKEPIKIDLPLKSSTVIAQGNAFGIELFKQVATGSQDNLMLSPLSASTALTMLMNGSEANTKTQLGQMLGYGSMNQTEVNAIYKSLVSQLLVADPSVELKLANAVFYDNPFQVKPSFITTLSTDFMAKTQALDFRSSNALKTINNWASENTNGKIEKVLDQIDPNAVMFLMNALYFKGIWTNQFDKDQTKNASFIRSNGESIQVPTMHGDIPYKTFTGENFVAIELAYGRQNFVMDIIMPTNSLESFLSQFDAELWNEIANGFSTITNPSEAPLAMPRFKFSYEKVLNNQLQAMGMTDAFDPSLANLTPISDEDIFVSFVKQNTFVDVNEEGTEAAAVTTIGIELTSMPTGVVINKPFLFVIREQTTNTLLFMGQVNNPNQN
jgi:serpin B